MSDEIFFGGPAFEAPEQPGAPGSDLGASPGQAPASPEAPMPGRPVRPVRRSSTGRRRVVAGAAAALVGLAAIGVGTAHAIQGSGTADYRTAVVTRSSVTATLERSGTVEPVTQASVSFPMSGTVATVGVSVGQSVTTGQVLGTLNGTSLQATLTSKQATLAQAQLVVSQAETAEADASTAATAATAAASSSSKTSGQPSSASSSQTHQEATAVTSAQQQVDQDLQFANAAVQAVTQTCGSSPSSSAGATGSAETTVTAAAAGTAATTKAPSATGTATAAATGTSSTSTTTPTTTAPTATSACTAAIQSALVAQQNLASSEAALAKAEAALQSTLNQAVSSATTSTTQASTAARTVASTTSSAAGQSSVGATQSATVPSAADLVADQAAVDADEAQVAVAQQNLAEATIVSPINGTIAQVGVAVGQQVSAASSTAAIVVVGQGGWEVATTVPVASIADVALGDSATVVADGHAQPLGGKVVELGVAPNSAGDYAVVVGFTTSPSGLGNGASATVTIDSAAATQALTVPTSAVHAAGGVDYVSTLANGKLTNTFVQVGVMGADRTEIKSGLQAGQVVVLADLNTALPSANTTSGRVGVATSALAGGGVVRTGSATRSQGG